MKETKGGTGGGRDNLMFLELKSDIFLSSELCIFVPKFQKT